MVRQSHEKAPTKKSSKKKKPTKEELDRDPILDALYGTSGITAAVTEQLRKLVKQVAGVGRHESVPPAAGGEEVQDEAGEESEDEMDGDDP